MGLAARALQVRPFPLCVGILAALATAATTTQATASDVTRNLRCVSLGTYTEGDSPPANVPSERIDALVDALVDSVGANCIYVFTFQANHWHALEAAERRGVSVINVAWLEPNNTQHNTTEINLAVVAAQRFPNLIRIACGSELSLRVGFAVADPLIIDCARRLRQAGVTVPIGTSDTWYQQCVTPGSPTVCNRREAVAAELSWVGVTIYPVFEQIYSGWYTCLRPQDAPSFIRDRLRQVQVAYPNHAIVLTEHGHPASPAGPGPINTHTGEQCLPIGRSEQVQILTDTRLLVRDEFVSVIHIGHPEPWKNDPIELGFPVCDRAPYTSCHWRFPDAPEPTATPTLTPVPTAVATPSPTATAAPAPTHTAVPSSTSTATAIPSASATALPTVTSTSPSTRSPSPTFLVTATPAGTVISSTPSLTPTASLSLATSTPTATPSLLSRGSPTATRTPLLGVPTAQMTVSLIQPTVLPTSLRTPDPGLGGQVFVLPTVAAGQTAVAVINPPSNASFLMSLIVPVPGPGETPIGVRVQPQMAVPTGVVLPDGVTVAKVVEIDVYDPSTGNLIHDHGGRPLDLAIQLTADDIVICLANPARLALLHVDLDGKVTRVAVTRLDCAAGILQARLFRTSAYAIAQLGNSLAIPFRAFVPASLRNTGGW